MCALSLESSGKSGLAGLIKGFASQLRTLTCNNERCCIHQPPKAKKLMALPEIKDYVCYACEYQREEFSIWILMAKACTG